MRFFQSTIFPRCPSRTQTFFFLFSFFPFFPRVPSHPGGHQNVGRGFLVFWFFPAAPWVSLRSFHCARLLDLSFVLRLLPRAGLVAARSVFRWCSACIALVVRTFGTPELFVFVVLASLLRAAGVGHCAQHPHSLRASCNQQKKIKKIQEFFEQEPSVLASFARACRQECQRLRVG